MASSYSQYLDDIVKARQQNKAIQAAQKKAATKKAKQDLQLQSQVQEETKPTYGIEEAIAIANRNNSVSDAVAHSDLEQRSQSYFRPEADSMQKYYNNGIQVSKYRNMDKELAEKQGELTKIGNGIFSAVVGNFALGIAGGFADLFIGLPKYLFTKSYDNAVSRAIESGQKAVNDFAPIYTDPVKDEAGEQTYGTFIGQTAQTVGTMASFVIPTTGFVGVLGKAAKVAKLGTAARTAGRFIGNSGKWLTRVKDTMPVAEMNRLQRASTNFSRWANNPNTILHANQVIGSTANAAVNRFLWNYQEGRHTYDQMYIEAADAFKNFSPEEYQEWLDNNKEIVQKAGGSDKNTIAKYISKQAADTAFAFDWNNIAFDLLQYYTLRNTWKGANNRTINMSKLSSEQQKLAKTLGKSEAEQAAIMAKPKWYTWGGVKDRVGDSLKGGKTLLFGQLSGGAQMAIVHMGTEEGLGYGRSLITGEKQDSLNRRINSYLNSSELWEGVFMGVIGGIAHHGLGSAIGGAKRSWAAKREQAKATNEKTGETKASVGSKILDWYLNAPLTQTQIQKKELESRARNAEVYAAQVEMIKNNKNPFLMELDGKQYHVSGNEIDIQNVPEGAEHASFGSDIEREVALDTAERIYLTKIARSANNAGNGKLLEEWIDNEDVQKYFLDRGVVDADGLKELSARSKKIIKDVNDTYEKHYDLVESVISDLNSKAKSKDTITSQYIQLIVDHNAGHELSMKELQSRLDRLNDSTTKRETALKELGSSQPFIFGSSVGDFTEVNAREVMKQAVLATKLGSTKAQLKYLRSKENKTITDVYNIKALEREEKRIKDQIVKNNVNSLAFATYLSAGYEVDPETGNVKSYNADLAKENIDKFLYEVRDGNVDYDQYNIDNLNSEFNVDILSDKGLKLDRDSFTKANKEFTKLYNQLYGGEVTLFNLADVLKGKDSKNLDDATIKSLRDSIEPLQEEYRAISEVEDQIDYERSQIALTKDSISDLVNEWHNTLNQARVDVIDSAYKTIQDLALKYDFERIGNIVEKYYTNIDELDKDITFLTSSEQSELKDALTYLNLSSPNNYTLFNSIQKSLNQAWLLNTINKASAESSTNGEKSSTNENPPAETKKPTIEEAMDKAKQADTSQSKSVNKDSDDDTPAYTNIEFKNDGDNVTIKAKDDNSGFNVKKVTSDSTDDDAYEVDVISKIEELRKKGKDESEIATVYIQNDSEGTALFDIRTAMVDGGKVFKNPVITIDSDTGEITLQEQGIIGKEEEINAGEEDARFRQDTTQPEGEVKPEPNYDNGVGIQPEQRIVANEPGSDDLGVGTTGDDNINNGVRFTDDKGEKTVTTEEELLGVTLEEVYMDFLNSEPSLEKLEDLKSELELATQYFSNKDYVNQKITDTLNYVRETLENESTRNSTIVSSVNALITSKATQISSLRANNKPLNISRFNSIFQQAFASIIKQFDDVYFLEKYENTNKNGDKVTKYIINLEDLLRYVQVSTRSKSVAKVLFDELVAYLKTSDAKNRYVIKDIKDGDNRDILRNVEKTIAQRIKEDSKKRSYRIPINDYLDDLEKQAASGDAKAKGEVTKVLKEFERLKVGDELNWSRNDDGKIVVSSNGTTLGMLSVPTISKDGTFTQINKGWITDIKITPEGVESKLKDKFLRWFVPKIENNEFVYGETKDDNDNITTLHKILDRWQYETHTPELEKELIAQFKELTEIQNAESLIKKNADYSDLITMLNRVKHYVHQRYFSVPELNSAKIANIQNKEESVTRWFDVLATTYSVLHELTKTNKGTITVSRLNDGELNLIHKEAKVANFGNTKPVKEALVERLQPLARIALVPPTNTGYGILVSGHNNFDNGIGARVGQTYVMVPNRNSNPQYVQAFPGTIKAHTGIRDAVKNKLEELIEAHGGTQRSRNETYNELQKFIYTLLDNKWAKNNSEGGSIRGIFRGVTYNDNLGKVAGFAINGSSTKTPTGRADRIIFYSRLRTKIPSRFIGVKGKDSNIFTTLDLANEGDRKNAVKAIMELLDEEAIFNIDRMFIQSDNDTSLSFGGFASRTKDGKFVIKIPNAHDKSEDSSTFVADSFNDFVLKNGLVHINTKPVEGMDTNFNRRGVISQRGNMGLFTAIDVNVEPIISQSRIKAAEALDSRTTKIPTSAKVKAILDKSSDSTSKKRNDGVAIVKAIYGETQHEKELTEFLSKRFDGKGLNLFPKIVKFDPNFNKPGEDPTEYAKTNRTEVTVGSAFIDILDKGTAAEPDKGKREAVRILIHERIHQLFRDDKNKPHLETLREIYDAFVKANNDDGISATDHIREFEFKHQPNSKGGKRYIDKDGRINEEGLEEFLIESITNQDLINRLNEIKIDYTLSTGKKTKRTLLQKIFEVVGKLLGFEVKDGTLMAKEFDMLRDLLDNTDTNRGEKVEDLSKIEKPSSSKPAEKFAENDVHQHLHEALKHPSIKVAPDEQTKGYKDTMTKLSEWITWTGTIANGNQVRFDRDTHTYIYKDENGKDEHTVDITASKLADFLLGERDIRNDKDYTFAQEIGNSVDSILRDYYNGVKVMEKEYPNFNNKRKEILINSAKKAREFLDSKLGKGKYTIITTEFPLLGKIGTKADAEAGVEGFDKTIAGTMDMLIVDSDGNIYIWDFKAKNKALTEKYSKDDVERYSIAMRAYKSMLENVVGKKKVKKLRLMWLTQSYPKQGEDGIEYTVDANTKKVTVRNNNTNKEIALEDFEEWKTPKLNTKDIENTALKSLDIEGDENIDYFEPINDSWTKYEDTKDNERLETANKESEKKPDDPVTDKKQVENLEDSQNAALEVSDDGDDFYDTDIDSYSTIGNIPNDNAVRHSIASMEAFKSSLLDSEAFDNLVNKGFISITCK